MGAEDGDWGLGIGENLSVDSQSQIPNPKSQKLVLALLVAFHLLVPLRHHYFKGEVAWTEEGHRFSWRMMLRSKHGYGYFDVKNVRTGEVTKIKPEDYLTDRQSEKLYNPPGHGFAVCPLPAGFMG